MFAVGTLIPGKNTVPHLGRGFSGIVSVSRLLAGPK